MPKSSNKLTTDQLGRLIYEIRGERVMLDSDLASIYGIETKALNRAVKCNRDRFPKDLLFQITEDEWKDLRYQIGASSLGHGGRRNRPYVFTEHGAIMAAECSEQPTSCADEYDVRGRRWMDCIGRIVMRPSVSGERESTGSSRAR
jgi:hypothetical protein